MENDRGTWPATPASPATSANQKDRLPSEVPAQAFRSPAIDTAHRGSDAGGLGPADDDGGAEAEIEAMYRTKFAGIRRLPRHQRPLARRAAREWRQSALRALREKRAGERYARLMRGRPRPQAPR